MGDENVGLTSSLACRNLMIAYFLTLGCEKAGLSSSRASSTFMGLHLINISRAAVDSCSNFQLTLFKNLAKAYEIG